LNDQVKAGIPELEFFPKAIFRILAEIRPPAAEKLPLHPEGLGLVTLLGRSLCPVSFETVRMIDQCAGRRWVKHIRGATLFGLGLIGSEPVFGRVE
jgi:hypothetical protein